MKSGARHILAGFLATSLLPAAVTAQSRFDGTWKLDVATLPTPKGPFVWVVQNGFYECKSCMPAIRVRTDGQDQNVSGQPYDTISVTVVDARTIHLIEKKNDQIVSDETFTISDDGQTVTDEVAYWKVIMRRIAGAPPGSHLISGTWQPFKLESTSDKWLLITYKMNGNTLSMSQPTGQSYRAKLDGTDAPYHGEPRFNGVSVKRIDANTIEEIDRFNDKALVVSRMVLSTDGKSMTIAVKDLESGETGRFTASKQ